MDDPNLNILMPIARALGDLCESLVFVGGCATGLLVTVQRAQAIRPTMDVDVVAHAITIEDYHAMERALEARGFKHDLTDCAPICRWVMEGVLLDMMPSGPGILGFHNRWYPWVMQTAQSVELPNGQVIRLITAPLFVATKFEAFLGRGRNDYLASHDLEDLITLVDGRHELIEEIKTVDAELRRYIAHAMSRLLGEIDFQSALPGQIPGDAASQARLPELIRRLRSIAELDN
jgi:predicted nucleotidyltransferase